LRSLPFVILRRYGRKRSLRRLVENVLHEVDRGVIEASRPYAPAADRALVLRRRCPATGAATVTGWCRLHRDVRCHRRRRAGPAVRYGYQRAEVMVVTVALLLVLVSCCNHR
jgi:ABC-type methionine transport system permease subunit